MTISRSQRQAVRERAGNCCEYCRFPASGGTVAFHVDHIIPIKHGGSDDLSNLCLACYKCNAHKGHDLVGIDPETEGLIRLYHPRNRYGMNTSQFKPICGLRVSHPKDAPQFESCR